MVSLAGVPENAAVLKQCFLFEPLSAEDRDLLARHAYRQDFRADERIFGYGDPGESMMIILLGSIRLRRPTPGDKEIILGDRGVGDILGEMALLDGKPRSAEARAVTNGQFLVLTRRELLPFLESHPKVCLTLLGVLCDKIREADERWADTFTSLSARLAKTIVRQIGSEKGGKLSISQKDLANMVGVSREGVNRQLGAWHEEGLIELKQGWIIVSDPQALLARSKSPI